MQKHHRTLLAFQAFTVLIMLVSGYEVQAQSSCGSGEREFNLVNRCGETIWVGAEGLPPGGWQLDAGPADCSTTTDCPAGQTCNRETNQCQLTLCVPGTFSGRLWPRTGCDFNSDGVCSSGQNCCDTGGCTTSSGGWGLECSSGGQSPITTTELTLSQEATDFYDVSVIDGFNLAVEVNPIGNFQSCPFANAEDCDYWCTNPGGKASSNPDLKPCTWEKVLNATSQCGGNPALRVVSPTSCNSDADCTARSTCNLGTHVCECTSDSDCHKGEICGVGNNNIIGYRACGQFAGCTTAKVLCGIGAYFSHGKGGDACSEATDCASNTCNNGQCTVSPVDTLDCDMMYPRTVACSGDDECPLLVGIKFEDSASCGCPPPTKCSEIGGTSEKPIYGCRETCVEIEPDRKSPMQRCTMSKQ
jgi:hypothetical protein